MRLPRTRDDAPADGGDDPRPRRRAAGRRPPGRLVVDRLDHARGPREAARGGLRAPAPRTARAPTLVQLQSKAFRCPYCGSTETRLDNLFGPTPCRSVRYCESCGSRSSSSRQSSSGGERGAGAQGATVRSLVAAFAALYVFSVGAEVRAEHVLAELPGGVLEAVHRVECWCHWSSRN